MATGGRVSRNTLSIAGVVLGWSIATVRLVLLRRPLPNGACCDITGGMLVQRTRSTIVPKFVNGFVCYDRNSYKLYLDTLSREETPFEGVYKPVH